MNGLVLAGGKSTRMGIDKSSLVYHDVPQYQYVYDLLLPYCDRVFVSTERILDLPTLPDLDLYKNSGPIGGLLSAFEFALEDWIVIAIDYPYFSSSEIEELIGDQNELASVIYHSETGYFEPFLGIYKAKFKSILIKNFEKGNHSMQSILTSNPVGKVLPSKIELIRNVNTIDEFKSIQPK